MGSKSSPKAPDYTGAAEAQSEASKDITQWQTFANRPNMNTPWGSSQWNVERGIDPTTGKSVPNWTQDINLSPEQQRAFDDQQAIQGGRSELAQGLLGNANQEMQTPGDFWNTLPDIGQTPDVPNYYGQNLPSMGEFPDPTAQPGESFDFEGGYGDLGAYGNVPQAGGMLPQRGFVPGSENQDFLPGRGQGPGQESYSPESIQSGLDFSGQQQLDAGGGYNPAFAQTQFDRQMSLQGPRMEQQREAMDVRLRNQGLSPGSQAYDRAMKDMRDQQGEQTARMSQDSMRLGAQEQQAQFGRELQSRQQGVGEVGQQGMFANQAAQQGLQQQLGIGGQRFDQGMAGGQFSDQQRQQALQEQQQRFGQRAQSSQMTDAQRAQASAEQQQGFGQQMGAGQFQDQQRGQQFGELGALQGMFGGQANDRFNRELQSAQFANQQRQQAGQEQLAFGQQGFGQQLQQGQFQQSQRQNAIAEQLQREGWSLNKINAALSGQQVGMPSFPNTAMGGAQQSQAPQYLNAANMQGQYGLQAQQNAQAPWAALGNIGGSVLGGMASGGTGFFGS